MLKLFIIIFHQLSADDILLPVFLVLLLLLLFLFFHFQFNFVEICLLELPLSIDRQLNLNSANANFEFNIENASRGCRLLVVVTSGTQTHSPLLPSHTHTHRAGTKDINIFNRFPLTR